MSDLWRRLGRLLLHWTLACVIAGAAGYAVLTLAADYLGAESTWTLPAALVAAALVAGVLAGWSQQRLLAPFWQTAGGWAAMTALGWTIGLPLAVGLSALLRGWVRDLPDSYRLTIFLLGAGAVGAAASLGQWRLVRRLTDKHLWWPLANGVGWFMAWIVVLAMGLFLGEGAPLPIEVSRLRDALMLGAMAGFVVGFEQGVALVGLLAQEAWENRSRH